MHASSRVTAAAVILLASLGLAAPTASAEVAAPIVVPINGASDVVADEATQQVFVSSETDDSVVVLSYTGTVIDTLTGIDGAAGMTLDPSSGTVYVAAQGSSEIAAIDATTLDVTLFPTTGTANPRNVAVSAEGIVFYGYSGSPGSSSGGVGVLDPEQADPTGVSAGLATLYQPQVVAAGDVLVVAEIGLTPSSPSSYTIDGTTLTTLGGRYNVGSNTQDLAIAPDASEVVVASGAPYEHPSFDPATFTSLFTYPTTTYPNAAAISDGGSLVALGTNSSWDDDIWLFHRGDTTPVTTIELDGLTPAMTLYPGGLALGGTDRVFALGWETYFDAQRYLVIHDLEDEQETSLTLSAPERVRVGDEAVLSGRLGEADEFAGQSVSLTRSTPLGTTSLGTAEVQADGTFTFTDTPDSSGGTRYIARWAGDDTHAPAIGISNLMSVVLNRSTLTVTTDATRYRAGQRARVTVTLDHRDSSPDSLQLRLADAEGDRVVRYGSFERRSVTFKVPVTSNGQFTAIYLGSTSHRSASDRSQALTVLPAVRATVDNFFRRDGNHWWLRPSVTPTVRWTVTPAPVGPCARTTLQKRTSEGWRTITRSLCVNATDTSTFTRTFDSRRHDGVEWRVRMTSGSTETHAELKSRWTYITFKALPTARQAN